jgi:hypothetical protein
MPISISEWPTIHSELFPEFPYRISGVEGLLIRGPVMDSASPAIQRALPDVGVTKEVVQNRSKA